MTIFDGMLTANVVTLANPGDQTNNGGDNMSLQLSATDANHSTLTYQASGLPSGLSINSSTGLISGKVASGNSANGPYSVTVTATDTQGYSSYQQFTWTINAPTNALTLTNPGNQSNTEGDNVSLQLQASDPDGDTLEYAASGLPIGLMVDPSTGLISGTVDSSAAAISSGDYNVTVTVNDGNGQTVSQSFVWSITNTPQTPWLEPPDFQDNQTDTSASLQLVGGSPGGDALSYSASGLPSGLSVNPNTGLISGTITASAGSYTVTATVTDSVNNLSASQSFTWQVTSGNAPRVLMSFDGQPAGEDYVAGVDPATPVPVLVTLEGATPGLHTITLSIPSGESTLSLSKFQLSDGGSETVEMTPVKVSQSFDDSDLVAYVDGQEAGDPWFTNVKVTIAGAQNGGHISAKDTPQGMTADRIPPANMNADHTAPYTEVAFTITPTLKDEKVVYFNVRDNAKNTTGTAYLLNKRDEPRESVWYQKSGSLYVVGENLTQSHPGNLSIAAYPGTNGTDGKPEHVFTDDVLTGSAGFSVSAIPIAVRAKKPDPGKGELSPQGPFWGAKYEISLKSDSGDPNDLVYVEVSEYAHYRVHTGIWTGPFEKEGIYVDPSLAWYSAAGGAKPFPPDHNGTISRGDQATAATDLQKNIAVRLAKGEESKFVMQQVFIFSDVVLGIPANRYGTDAITIAASGYQITAVAVKDGNNYSINVTREAKDVSVQPSIEIGRDKNKNYLPIMKQLAERSAAAGTNDSAEPLKDPVQ